MDGKQQELGQDESWNPWSFERPDPDSDQRRSACSSAAHEPAPGVAAARASTSSQRLR